MVAVYPSHIVRHSVCVLNLVRGQKGRAANLRYIVEGQLRQAAVSGHVWNPREAAGKVQQLFTGLVCIDLLPLRVNPVVAQAELIGQIATEQMRPAGRETAVGVVFIPAEESATIAAGVIEGPGIRLGWSS